jgi:hypothetical protein
MNKMPFDQPSNSEDELLPEYQFDYQKAKPNRFANRSGKSKLTVVLLEFIIMSFVCHQKMQLPDTFAGGILRYPGISTV